MSVGKTDIAVEVRPNWPDLVILVFLDGNFSLLRSHSGL